MSKFTEIWSGVENQNKALWWCLMMSIASFGIVGIGFTKTSLKPPLVIDSCHHDIIELQGEKVRSKKEIEDFARLALGQRFDSESTLSEVFFSKGTLKLKMEEQKDLRDKGLGQKLIMEKFELTDKQFSFQVTRLLSMNKIRTAQFSTVKMNYAVVPRSSLNPYGLVVTSSFLEDPKKTTDGSKKASK